MSDITLFDGPKSQPIYPMRKRGRPKQKEMASNSTSNNKPTGEIDESFRTSRKKIASNTTSNNKQNREIDESLRTSVSTAADQSQVPVCKS